MAAKTVKNKKSKNQTSGASQKPGPPFSIGALNHYTFYLLILLFVCTILAIGTVALHAKSGKVVATGNGITLGSNYSTIFPGINEASVSMMTSPSAYPRSLVQSKFLLFDQAPTTGSPQPKLPSISVPILMYHYIRYMYNSNDKNGYRLSVAPNVFEQEMAYLKARGFTTITPQQLDDAITNHQSLPAKPIMVTFDDGYADFASEAMRVLREYNIKATIFIPTDLMGTPNYLTWDQLKSIANNPSITIAAHTRHHANLVQIPESRLDDEIVNGKLLLEAKLGRKIDFFAYPYGTFNAAVVSVVKKAGFKDAFSTIEGRAQSLNSLYALHRIAVPGTDDLAQFSVLVGP